MRLEEAEASIADILQHTGQIVKIWGYPVWDNSPAVVGRVEANVDRIGDFMEQECVGQVTLLQKYMMFLGLCIMPLLTMKMIELASGQDNIFTALMEGPDPQRKKCSHGMASFWIIGGTMLIIYQFYLIVNWLLKWDTVMK